MIDKTQELEVEFKFRSQFRAYAKRIQRWACLVVHRRGGKTYGCTQDIFCRALAHERKGPPLRYAYVAPTRDQAKDIVWGYMSRFAAMIPGTKANQADLRITLPNQASIRLYSGENYERMRGLYFDGVVLDEFGDIDPAAWSYVIRPTLTDYRGWATMIGTPKGRNQFYRTWQGSTTSDAWYSLMLKASESGLIPAEELAEIRADPLTTPQSYDQEYECNFNVSRPGAIFAPQLSQAYAEGRVDPHLLPYAEYPFYTAWDIGAAVNTKCWIWQLVGNNLVFHWCLTGGPQKDGSDLRIPPHWVPILKSKAHNYGGHFLPHDGEVLWKNALAEAGLEGVAIVPKVKNIWNAINPAISGMARCRFNELGCQDGLDALDSFHSAEKNDGITIQNVPVHDWSSHAASAFITAHAAVNAGMVVDRSAIPRKPLPRRRHGMLAKSGLR